MDVAFPFIGEKVSKLFKWVLKIDNGVPLTVR